MTLKITLKNKQEINKMTTDTAKELAKEMNSKEIYLAIKRTQQHLIFLKSLLEAKTDIKINEIVEESTSS